MHNWMAAVWNASVRVLLAYLACVSSSVTSRFSLFRCLLTKVMRDWQHNSHSLFPVHKLQPKKEILPSSLRSACRGRGPVECQRRPSLLGERNRAQSPSKVLLLAMLMLCSQKCEGNLSVRFWKREQTEALRLKCVSDSPNLPIIILQKTGKDKWEFESVSL